MRINKKNILVGALATAGVVGLAACGSGADQDSGDPQGTLSRTLSARAVDGYLVGATVYVDLNENGRPDVFEPRALTDADGYFSFNHATGTDYCAADALPEHARYCLRVRSAAGESLLIGVTGGYDSVSSLPFEGTLNLRSSDLDAADMRFVTPLTSLVAGGRGLGTSRAAGDGELTAQQKFDALVAAGIFNPAGENPMDLGHDMSRTQFALVIAQMLGHARDDLDESLSFQDVPDHAFYSAFLGEMSSSWQAGSLGSGTFDPVQELTLEQMSQILVTALGEPNAAAGEPGSSEWATNYVNAAIGAGLLQSMKDLDAATRNAGTLPRSTLVQLSYEVLKQRGKNNPADPQIQNFVEWVENQLTAGVGADLDGLDGNVDLSVLFDEGFTFDPASNAVTASAALPPAAAQVFDGLVGKSFDFQLVKDGESGAAAIFVGGQPDATSGTLDLCVRYKKDGSDFDTVSVDKPNGALHVSGNWSRLNAHSLVLSIDVMGGARAVMLKSVGADAASPSFRFDFGGEATGWDGGSVPAPFTGAVPASDADCEDRLFSRFGAVI